MGGLGVASSMRERQALRPILLVASILALSVRASWALPIDFESLMDLEAVTNQFAADHVTFSNAIALTAGMSLNEFEFPPRSGQTVVSDDGGPMMISFSVPFQSIEGYFTYATPITLTAFSDAAGTIPISGGSVMSLFGSNLALSGDGGSSPNEFLQLAGIGPIGSIKITGDRLGGSFTLDDLNGAPIPEPASVLLLGSGLAGLLLQRSRRFRQFISRTK